MLSVQRFALELVAVHRCTGRQSLNRFEWRRKLHKLWRISADDIPGRFGACEDVHLDSNTRITIDAAESYAMHLSVVCPAEGRSARTTEAKAPSRRRFVVREVLFSAGPDERTGRNFRVGGT